MAETRKKRPRDPIALAKLIGDIATGQVEDREQDDRNPAAVELGRKGGLKGGKARWKGLSVQERSEIARKAVRARWAKVLDKPEGTETRSVLTVSKSRKVRERARKNQTQKS